MRRQHADGRGPQVIALEQLGPEELVEVAPGARPGTRVPSCRKPRPGGSSAPGHRAARDAERDEVLGVGEPQHQPHGHDAGQRAGHVGAPVGGDDDVQAERAALGGQAREQLHRLAEVDALVGRREAAVAVDEQDDRAGAAASAPRCLRSCQRPAQRREQPQDALALVAADDRAAVRQRLDRAQRRRWRSPARRSAARSGSPRSRAPARASAAARSCRCRWRRRRAREPSRSRSTSSGRIRWRAGSSTRPMETRALAGALELVGLDDARAAAAATAARTVRAPGARPRPARRRDEPPGGRWPCARRPARGRGRRPMAGGRPAG